MIETFYPSEVVDIDSLSVHPDNYNAHSDKQLGHLSDSLRQFGQFKNIIAWRQYIIAGHGLVEAARARGWKRIEVKRLPDEWNESRVKAVLVADNEIARQSEPNQESLAALLQEVSRYDAELLGAAGFGEEDLRALLASFTPPDAGKDTEPQIDMAEELRQKWGVESGQLWTMGAHRLICGDCTDRATVERVMGVERIDCITTDPPYGVDYDGGTKVRERLNGDKSPTLYLPALTIWKPYSQKHIALYLWYADGDQAVAQAVAQAGWHVRRNLIWSKNQAQFGALSQQYHQKHEPFLYCHLKGESPFWAGDASEVTVWDIDRHSVNEFHPTQKPPALFERAIRNSSTQGAIVFDGFAGSGTTGIACHNLGRKARMIEISAPYCAVILERMSQHTGQSPALVD